MKVSAPSLRPPLWGTCLHGRVCSSPCSSADASYIYIYTGKDITAAHAQPREQGLNDTHFDAFLKHSRAALEEVGVKADKAEKVMKLLEGKRGAVLNR